MYDPRRVCFFCDKEIIGKKTLEHVVPNSLLGKLGVKEETIVGFSEVQYSRIKVPAHPHCNNEFGAIYESKALKLLEDPDALYESIRSDEPRFPMIYGPGESNTEIITTWLSKIYYGLFYYDYISTDDEIWKQACAFVIEGHNFDLVRCSYKYGFGFQLPSSLYAFKTKDASTDLVTLIDPSSILLKIGSLTLVLCICDGWLTKHYLNDKTLDRLRSWIDEEERLNESFPAHKLALGEIAALRSCIPKSPKFVAGEKQIINLSCSTMAANPDEAFMIDDAMLKEARKSMLREFNIELAD